MIHILERAAIGRPTNVRVYLRPRRITRENVGQYCGWVYERDEEFLSTGKRSIRCHAPVHYEFGERSRPRYYCKTHGDFIILRMQSPREARKVFAKVNKWRER